MLLLSIALSFPTFCLLLNSVRSQTWTHQTILDENGRYHLYWTPPEDTKGDSEITFKVEVKTRGYIGYGLSQNGGMDGSDIVTMWIKDSEVYFQDRHGVGFTMPVKDDKQNYELISGEENDTHTIFTFRRKLDTCDDQDMIIDESTMRVIYAFSEEDPESEDPFYHGRNRGTKSVMLLQNKGQTQQNLDLSSMLQWDVKSPGIDISSHKSLYWCKIYASPNVSMKHHITYMKPIIQQGNEPFVHHMVWYGCAGATPEEYEDYVDYMGHECFHPNMPLSMQKCQAVTLTWAIGGQDVVFPEHVGLPLIQGTYFMMEMHYDNPERRQGIIDYSGMRFYYTPKLREHDAGSLPFGSVVSPRMFIPPGQDKYTVTGHGNPDCLAPVFPTTGVKAMGILLHAHLIARAIKVRHFRGNQELVPLAYDKYYDFNYQDYRYFKKEVVILPNDQITVECDYNSSQRSEVTFGGLSTREEMCLAHILYYPLVDIYGVVSAPTFDCINKILKTNSTQESEIEEDLMRFDWENANVSHVETVAMECKHDSYCTVMVACEEGTDCTSRSGNQETGKNVISYPKNLKVYVEKSTCSTDETCSNNETCRNTM